MEKEVKQSTLWQVGGCRAFKFTNITNFVPEPSQSHQWSLNSLAIEKLKLKKKKTNR